MISFLTNIVTFWKLLEGSCAYLIMHTYFFFAKTIILSLHLILMLFCRNGGFFFFKMVSFDQDPYLIFKQK